MQMATTIEAKTREQAAEPVQRRPWYRDRQRLPLVAVALVAIVAAAAWFIIASGKRKEQFAARSLNQARAAAEAGNLPLASSELQRLITTYKGTDAAHEAVITLNQVRMVNGQSELAVVGLREFLAGNPPEKYRAPAYALLGSSLENAKRWGEAADAYTKASESAQVPYLKATHLISAGRAYALAGKPQEAAKAYRTVVQKYADSPSFTEAQVRLAEVTGGKM
jgi:predicted negative regulator of RcsB-dependent stress response